MTATRLPLRSTLWSQRAEWNDGPANDSMPLICGNFGWLSWPVALTTAFASSVSSLPSAVRELQRPERAVVVPRHRQHFGVEADVVDDAELDGAGAEVVEQRRALEKNFGQSGFCAKE